jgi:type I restriction enzyme S subunit
MDAGRVLFESAQKINDTAFARIRKGIGRGGDVLFSHKGTVGKLALVPLDAPLFVCSPQTTFWRTLDQEHLDRRFLYYFMQSQSFIEQWSARKGETDMADYVSLSAQRQLDVVVPRISEQRSIAAVLGSLDDKIEHNRRTVRALERLARAIFRAWFVDFEPVKAKAAGVTSFPSVPQEVFDALPTRLVDSEIGPVPERWEVGEIGRLAIVSRAQVKPQERPQEMFDHFSIPAFDAGMRPVREPGSAIKSNKFLVPERCVLLSKLNPRIPRVWLPPSPRGRRQIASTEFLVFVLQSAFDRHYLYCQFQQLAFREEFTQGAFGTSNSHQRVRPADLLQKAAILPPTPIRKGFAGIADPLFALAAAIHVESAALAEVRDYLLSQLMSGRVRVGAHDPKSAKRV